jgi:hypothetical protein
VSHEVVRSKVSIFDNFHEEDIRSKNSNIDRLLLTSAFIKESIIIRSKEKQSDVEILNRLALSISASTKNFCVANDQILSNIDLSTFIIRENSSFIDFDDDHLFEDEASNEIVSFNADSFNAISSSKNISSVRTTRKTSIIAKKIESSFRKIIKLLKITKTKFRVSRKYIDSSLKNILILMK